MTFDARTSFGILIDTSWKSSRERASSLPASVVFFLLRPSELQVIAEMMKKSPQAEDEEIWRVTV